MEDDPTDGTGAKLMPMADGDRIRVLTHPKNRERCRAVTGLQAARGDLVIVTLTSSTTRRSTPNSSGPSEVDVVYGPGSLEANLIGCSTSALHHEPVSPGCRTALAISSDRYGDLLQGLPPEILQQITLVEDRFGLSPR